MERLILPPDIHINGNNGVNGHHKTNGLIVPQVEQEFQPQTEQASGNPLYALDTMLALLEEKYRDTPEYRRLLHTGRMSLRVSERYFRKVISSIDMERINEQFPHEKLTDNHIFRYGAFAFNSTLLHSAPEDLTEQLLNVFQVSLPSKLDLAVDQSHVKVNGNSWKGLFDDGSFGHDQRLFPTNLPDILVSLDYINCTNAVNPLIDTHGNHMATGYLLSSHVSRTGAENIYTSAALQPLEQVYS